MKQALIDKLIAACAAVGNRSERRIMCANCGDFHTPEQRTRREAAPGETAPLVCSKCGCADILTIEDMRP